MATLRQLRREHPEERYGLSDLVEWMQSGNVRFPVGVQPVSFAGPTREQIPVDFAAYTERIYKANGIVAACMGVREAVFSQVRFRFQSVNNGRPGDLFGTEALSVLERPWPNGTTGELAKRMIQDVDLAGNFYAVVHGGRIWRRDPQKMTIVLSGDPAEVEFPEVQGYLYRPSGDMPGGRVVTYLSEQVCHWSPKPDPTATYRGMSWLTPVLREIRADDAATDHKAEFFANAATPNMVVKTPESVMTEEQFDAFRRQLNEAHVGAGKRHKTLYLAPGADVEVIGRDFSQMDFANTQGRDETRIAAAAGVPAVIVGLKESLQGSALNAGNYGQARRRFADITMADLFQSAAAALERIVAPPQGRGAARLWFDTCQVPFFREDRRDAADIQMVKASTIRALVDAGYQPESVVAAVDAEDMTLLEHTHLFSVQLQPAGTGTTP